MQYIEIQQESIEALHWARHCAKPEDIKIKDD